MHMGLGNLVSGELERKVNEKYEFRKTEQTFYSKIENFKFVIIINIIMQF